MRPFLFRSITLALILIISWDQFIIQRASSTELSRTQMATEFVRDSSVRIINAIGAERNEMLTVVQTVADLPSIGRFTLGRYARRLSDEEHAEFQSAFSTWAIEQLRTQLKDVADSDIQVTGVTERRPGDYIVTTELKSGAKTELSIFWRVNSRSEAFKVIDIGAEIDGSLIWLAIEQRAQVTAVLDRSNGEVAPLIAHFAG